MLTMFGLAMTQHDHANSSELKSDMCCVTVSSDGGFVIKRRSVRLDECCMLGTDCFDKAFLWGLR